jgi:ferrous iron transport protein B
MLMEQLQGVKTRTVAIVGMPNSGKSTLFNALTGLRQRVANYPGVTVEPVVGRLQRDGQRVELMDLPGIYGLTPRSEDERIALAVLRGELPGAPLPERLLVIADATQLERGLVLLSWMALLQRPTALVVTMVDELRARGGMLDVERLEQALGIPVFTVVGRKGIGIEELRAALLNWEPWGIPLVGLPAEASAEERYEWARRLASQVVRFPQPDERTERIDRIVLHPLLGWVVFVLVMLGFFQAIFTLAQPAMGAIEAGIGWVQEQLETWLPEGVVRNFFAHGLVGGVGSVIVFLPQIVLLYFLLTLLEDTGYFARAAFLVDRFLGRFGLQGRSAFPLMGGFACAVPAILSTRVIPSWQERLATMLIIPLMTCSARLPVYTLLVGAMVPPVLLGGVVSLQALVMAGLYGLGAASGLVVAWVLRRTVLPGAQLPFFVEFPPYRLPTWRNVFGRAWSSGVEFLRTAGTTILLLSILLWALTELPPASVPPGTPPLEAQRIQLEQSLAGWLGHALEPLFAPLGFDWKITVAVLGSFAAREVFVAFLGQLYAVDIEAQEGTLRQVLSQQLSLPQALSIAVFYVFALQCIATMATLRRESGSWRWVALAFAYTFVLAYVGSWLTYWLAHWLL